MAAFTLHHGPILAKTPPGDDFSYFLGLKKFSDFKKTSGAAAHETVLTSPEFTAPIHWNELVVSWNADAPAGTYLQGEVRGIYPEHTTKYYSMGRWFLEAEGPPRASVRRQKDADGDMKTDTLVLQKPGARVQVRFTLGSLAKNVQPSLRFVGLSFCNTQTTPAPSAPFQKAWGHELPVIERSQNSYPEEQGWCSPTSLSMVLTHWAEVLQRKELSWDVPAVNTKVLDQNFGSGNWPFNTAFAGSFPGMRAYVTRFSSMAELEEWTASGVPVILSAPWHLLSPGRKDTGSGHIVVCTGFTSEGDVVINDPGTNPKKDRVRHVYKREDVSKAWGQSHHTVYLIYPISAEIPQDRLGHWERKK